MMFTGKFAACFSCFFAVSLLLLPPVGSLEVTLYDTAKLDTLGWTSYSPGLADRLGWREASYSKMDGSVLRVYTTCNIDFNVVNNWVRMPFLRRGEAARLYVNTKFTMRRCSGYPDPASVQLCKESFKLMFYESDEDIANATHPPWDDVTYASADIIAADRLFTDIDNATINDITRSIAPTKNGVYFAFYDQGACMTLLSVRVYYKVCPELASNLTIFGRTVTGPDVTSVFQTRARCTDHAASELPVYALCKADGMWMDLVLSDACRCLPGYQPDDAMKNCTECPVDTYKSWSGNGRCASCPHNSFAPRSGSTECQCADGFQRRASNGFNASCTNSLGPVVNLTVTYTNQTFVSLWWQAPGDKPVYYSVECSSCGSSVSYIPQQFNLNTTSISIDGLEPGGTYVIKVYVAEAGTSYRDGSVAIVTVTTKLSSGMPKIANVYIVRINDDSVDLVWTVDLGPTVAMETVTGYEVNYWAVNTNFTRSVVAVYPNISVFPLEPNTLYIFQVRARSAATWSEFSNPVSAKTESKTSAVSSATFDLVAVIAGTAVGVVACVIIIVVVAMMLIYRRKKQSSEGNNSDCDMLKYINGAQSLGRIAVNQSCSSLPSTATDSLHIYADPYAYEDPSHYARDRICEVESAAITIESILLTGCYGNMCVGKMAANGTTDVLVMIETLNESTSEDERIHFLSKAEVVWRLHHANIIAVKGVISKTTPHMIITEFMSNGSLKHFVKENGFRLQPNELLGMLHGIASAMAYITENGYVLRDLSAKSILLDDRLTCKVSYFDKLLYLEEDRIQLDKAEDVLLRWSPPEVLLQNCFSIASDVWSYGVLTWEVMSFGDDPYSGLSDDQVIRTVVGGNRLTLPQNCPDVISQLLAKCWLQNPDQRPTFATIVRILESSVQDSGSLGSTTQPTHRPDVTLRPSAFTPFRRGSGDEASLTQWLHSLQLAFYLANFHSRGYSEIGHVLHLTEADLEQVGVTVPSHRRLLLQSIQDLRTNASYIGNNDYYV